MSECGKIFVSFFKIGLFTFGGGYAMMPLFRRELIERRGYISENELIDYYSVGQCLPGVIAINVATVTGYKVQGVSGAIAATLAVNLPSLVIIMALAGILNTLSENQIVSHAFAGIRIGVIALILKEVVLLFRKAVSLCRVIKAAQIILTRCFMKRLRIALLIIPTRFFCSQMLCESRLLPLPSRQTLP